MYSRRNDTSIHNLLLPRRYYKPIKTNSTFNGNYIKIMMGSETNDIIEELFESLQKYQEIL